MYAECKLKCATSDVAHFAKGGFSSDLYLENDTDFIFHLLYFEYSFFTSSVTSLF